jgi:hypothetical protein
VFVFFSLFRVHTYFYRLFFSFWCFFVVYYTFHILLHRLFGIDTIQVLVCVLS